MMTFQKHVNELISIMQYKIEHEIPEQGCFKPLMEFFLNPDIETSNHVGKYGLKIYKMPNDIVADTRMRYVEAAAYSPCGTWKVDSIVAHGTKKEILSILQQEKFPNKLDECYGELLHIMKNL